MRLIVNNDPTNSTRRAVESWRERRRRVNDEQALERMRGYPGHYPDESTVEGLQAELSGMEIVCALLLGFGIVGWLLFFYAATRGAVLTAAS
jgi:hypothetical protein